MSKSKSDLVQNSVAARIKRVPKAPTGAGAMPGHNFRLEKEYYDLFQKQCKSYGLTVGAVTRMFILEFLKDEGLI